MITITAFTAFTASLPRVWGPCLNTTYREYARPIESVCTPYTHTLRDYALNAVNALIPSLGLPSLASLCCEPPRHSRHGLRGGNGAAGRRIVRRAVAPGTAPARPIKAVPRRRLFPVLFPWPHRRGSTLTGMDLWSRASATKASATAWPGPAMASRSRKSAMESMTYVIFPEFTLRSPWSAHA